jgi:hypothetical protein
LPALATKGKEVGLPGLLETSQTAGHKKTYTRPAPEYSETQVSAQKAGANLGHQATAERQVFDEQQLAKMITLAGQGVQSLIAKQQAMLGTLTLRQ